MESEIEEVSAFSPLNIVLFVVVCFSVLLCVFYALHL